MGTVTETQDMPYTAPAAAAPSAGDPSNPPAGQASADQPTTDNSAAQAPAPSTPATGAPAPSAPRDMIASRLTRYHFHIDEKFAGPDVAEIDVWAGGDDGDCGYRFKKGGQYVVYTQAETEGRLFATICNGTRPASDAKALLPQLRAMAKGQRVASVFGVLRRANPPLLSPPDDPDDPLPNIPLHLRSRDDRFQTTTGPDGVYSFYDVRAGEYNFSAKLPVRMELTQKTLTGGLPPFKIPGGACYEYDVDALPTGHIRGSVLGPDGKALQLGSVELYRAGAYDETKPGLWAFQGSDGIFDFEHVGPGDYIVVFNRMNRVDPNSPYPRAFYPGVADLSDAETIHVKDGQHLEKVNLNLGDGYPTRRVRVHVKWEGDRPSGDVVVSAKADTGDNPAARKAADGAYEITLVKSANYTISAFEDLAPRRGPAGRKAAACPLPAEIEASAATVSGSDEDTKELTLVFPKLPCHETETAHR